MKRRVLLADFSDTGTETEAIRQTLEYFGYVVLRCPIGRPNDLVDILADRLGHFVYDYLIMTCHGAAGRDDGKILMPALHESCYLKDEPRGNFGSAQIKAHIKLQNKLIISTGCSTGKHDSMTAAFVNSHSNIYVAPDDDPEGASALYFIQSLFYNLRSHDLEDAYRAASKIDEDTAMFKRYQ